MSRLFSSDQHKYLLSIAEGRTTKEIVSLINNKYDLSITVRQMQCYKRNHKIKSNVITRFEKGHKPINKGTKGMFNIGGNSTSFKKGDVPSNYKPIGYERVDRDGYILIKVADKGKWNERWKLKHKVLWEKANGPVPEGHKLMFADQNKHNVNLDNLILITQQQLVLVNKKRMLHKDADLNKTTLMVADILTKITAKTKSNANE